MVAMDAKHVAQERFGRYAASYVASRHHAGGSDLERLTELAGHHPGWVALDIATGGGHTALAVALQRPANVDFQLADAEDLPFPACSFDLVTCRIAAHHFPDPARFVAEVARVLQPSGLFLLQDQVTPEDPGAATWLTGFEKRRDPSHVRALSGPQWLALLGSSGFSVETEDRFEKRLRLVKWVADQGGTPEDLAELRAWLRQAPRAVQDWMHPTDIETDEARFSIHHCLFSAHKTGLGDLGAGC